jgi:hypothetical protein
VNYHPNESFNAVINDALEKVRVALLMASDNLSHAQAHEAHGIATQDDATIRQLFKARTWLQRSLRS